MNGRVLETVQGSVKGENGRNGRSNNRSVFGTS